MANAETDEQGTMFRGPDGRLFMIPGSLDVFVVPEDQEIFLDLDDPVLEQLRALDGGPADADLQIGKTTARDLGRVLADPADPAPPPGATLEIGKTAAVQVRRERS
jgi:hypothetical protein